MLKEQARLFTRITVLIDILMILISFYLAFYIRSLQGGLTHIRSYAWVLLFVLPVWYFLLTRYGLYASVRTRSLPKLIASLVKVHFIGGIIAASLIYLFEPTGFSRGLFGYFLLISITMLSLEKTCLKFLLVCMRRRGYNYRNILVIGTDDRALDFIKAVEMHAGWGLRVAGVVRIGDKAVLEELGGYKVLSSLENLIDICKQATIDEVVFCQHKGSEVDLVGYLRDLEQMGITVRMVLDYYDVPLSRTELGQFNGNIHMLTFYSKAFDASQLLLKRCLDIFGAAVGLLLTIIFFPFIAIAIKIDSPGPLFFSQQRVGENGRIFNCFKFRSMHQDAERRKRDLLHLNEMNGAIFKIKDDPRITRVGRLLRKTSLDELPQFWNVFKGEMSLVGTRPPTPDEVANYENWHRKRICIRPGITGLWQVSGRNEIQDFDQVVRLDLEYIDHWTLWLDIKILLKTLWVVFARSGSC